MSTERGELADALRAIQFPHSSGLNVLTLDDTSASAIAETIRRSGYRKPRTITTATELFKLDKSAILRSKGGDAFQWGEDFLGHEGWFMTGAIDPLTTGQVLRFAPFTVLYEPEATA